MVWSMGYLSETASVHRFAPMDATVDSSAPAKWDRLLSFISTLEREGFSAGEWHSPPGVFPFFAYSPEILRFIEVAYEDGLVVPFDTTAWEAKARAYYDRPDLLRRARLITLRRLLTFHLRKDRFVEGHLPQMLEEGHILAILRRVSDLNSQKH